jgi:hypoxanthine phosphoribosyltransferase
MKKGAARRDNPKQAPAPVSFAHASEEDFARLLDFYGVAWQYEPRSFPLREENGRVAEAFTPDFFLPDLDLYIELTTLRQSLVTEKHRKLRLFQERYPETQVKLLHRSDYLSLLAKYGFGPFSEIEVAGIHEVLISASELERRIGELGAQLSREYKGREPLLVGVLRGVTCFMADLIRHVSLPIAIDYMAISSYKGAEGGAVRILKDLDEPLADRDVLVVEDIVDTGMTLHALLQELSMRGPATLKVCALLDKRARRLVDVPLDYVGFEVPDEFVVGYGLDFRQKFRNLPFIATLKSDWLRAHGRDKARPE